MGPSTHLVLTGRAAMKRGQHIHRDGANSHKNTISMIEREKRSGQMALELEESLIWPQFCFLISFFKLFHLIRVTKK